MEMKNKFWSNKEKFIIENYGSDYLESNTNSGIISYLQIPAELEILYDKDFGEFNSDEVMNVLNYMYTTSEDLVTTILSCFRRYHDWAIKVEMNRSKINAISMIDSKVAISTVVDYNEFYKSIVDKNFLYGIKSLEKKGNEALDLLLSNINHEDLDENTIKTLNRLKESGIPFNINYQDVIALILAFSGICGKSSKEICDLEWSDIDFQNKKINIIDKETGELLRVVDVDNYVINILEEAKKEKVYYAHISDRYAMNKEVFEFIDENDYVIKRLVTPKNTTATVNNVYLTKRLQLLKNDVDMLDLQEKNIIDYLNIQQCKLSGQIYMLNRIYDELKDKGLSDKKIKEDFKLEKTYEKVKLIWGETSNIYPLKNKFEKYMELKEKYNNLR